MKHAGEIIRWLSKHLGAEIRDVETGELLGKAFLLTFRGRLWVLGYTGKKGLRPVPVIQKEICYWVQQMAFAAAEEPDYPRRRGENEK